MVSSRTPSAAASVDLVALQRRTVRVLVAGQVLGGVGIGATLSIGAVLAERVSGLEEWSGSAATLSTLGAAAAAIPLSRLAQRLGRRAALTAGVLLSALGAVTTVVAVGALAFPLLLVGFALLGIGSAVNLQSRFAATDVASPAHRGRDLSIVVWSTTVGAVLGPNLVGPGEVIAETFRMPPLTGSFAIAVLAQLAAAVTYLVWLRPDPYLVSRAEQQQHDGAAAPSDERMDPRIRRLFLFAVGSIALSHAVMVAVMSMTPLHLVHIGSSLTIVGVTISLHIAGMFALSPLFGWLSDRVGRIQTILIGQGLFAVALVITALGESSAVLVTVGLVFSSGWAGARPQWPGRRWSPISSPGRNAPGCRVAPTW